MLFVVLERKLLKIGNYLEIYFETTVNFPKKKLRKAAAQEGEQNLYSESH